MTLTELTNNRVALSEKMKSFLDVNRDADGLLSAENDAVYARMEADFDALTNEIKRSEREAQREAMLNAASSRPVLTDPAKPCTDEKVGRASDAYKTNFWNMVRARGAVPSLMNALEEGVDSEGGYLVPDEFERRLIQALEEENFIRRYATVIKTTSGDHKIPVVSQHGTASWVDEEGAYQESDEAFTQVTLNAYKVCTMIKVSEELLQDSAFDLPAYFSSEFARRIGNAEEETFLTGNGSGKPTGILTAGGAGTGVTAAATNKITADELYDLYYSLAVPYRKKAIFCMHDSTVKALRKLKDGNGQYLWQPSLTAGEPDTLVGLPILTSPFCPEIEASAKSILLGDFSYYWIADRQARTFKRLNELFAVNGQIGFMGMQRVDGKVVLPEAFKCLVQAAS